MSAAQPPRRQDRRRQRHPFSRHFEPAFAAGFAKAAGTKAVLYAVTQPIEVNVAEIVVRPPRQIAL